MDNQGELVGVPLFFAGSRLADYNFHEPQTRKLSTIAFFKKYIVLLQTCFCCYDWDLNNYDYNYDLNRLQLLNTYYLSPITNP